MTGREVLEAGLRLPGAELTHPFGPQPAVLKVAGKVFALFAAPAADEPPDRVTVKCDPEYASALVRDHAAITRGYHMNKRHWNTVALDGSVPAVEVYRMIDHSYDLVAPQRPARRLRRAPTAGPRTIARTRPGRSRRRSG